ncbi:MAG: hypothetical protein K0Q66_487 [Chitinophagaceae bacterium]|jgi:hypothetical protein|nr:hypothetical protein [Chitinophagaceae bacterium]
MYNANNSYYQSELAQEYAYELSPELEFSNEYSNESAYELSPEFEMGTSHELNELANELAAVSNEYEFSSWLKKLAKKGAGVAANVLNSPVGQKATAALNNIANKTLPSLASNAGGFIGGQIGGSYGAQLGSQAGARAGQQAAGRYNDFVNFAKDTIQNIANEIEAGGNPAVKPAILKAASRHYPCILRRRANRNAAQDNEFDQELYGESDMQGEITHNEGTFNEVTEMELASELLTIQSEAELDQFLGKLFKKAVGAASKFAKSSAGKALGGVLKGIAKKALPFAGGALGTMIPIPGVGTAVGTMLGTAASNLFELELEGLSPEDREFEVAKAYVRLAGNAARRTSKNQHMQPSTAARQAVLRSARRFAPGLLARNNNVQNNFYGDENANGTEETGTWFREGNRIVIEGA